ncbi:MAG: hypothetical protein KGL75_11915 [Acidobacteriota bacterium]|nr:hypothetical protein [Acidobacteriota bacterium]
MARGWESKAVEIQIEDSKTKTPGKSKPQLTAEQTENRRRKQVLLLARTRVQRDLEASQHQRHTDQLNRALADLNAQLSALEDGVHLG